MRLASTPAVALAFFALTGSAFTGNFSPLAAQTQPSRTTPLENRTEARSLVQKLEREGKIIRPSQVKRGMRGYGLSVFQGTKIERFDIEVVGTLERVQGGGDLVMIRVLNGPVVQRESGIIQGMSGSPVYINGKLLGAIAIGFGFPKEPIGGVTPIVDMIETALPNNGPAQATPVKMATAYTPKENLQIAGRRIARVEVTPDASQSDFAGSMDAATMRMRPCTRLVLMSGISPASLGRWKKFFEPMGVTPMIGGGAMSGAQQAQVFGPSSQKSGVKANLAPGAAIGVQLASGDIDATGVGTVTFRDGNRVLAFGHPMFGLGRVSMPMTTAFVHDIFPSYEISFKLASPIDVVGELQSDSNFAIGGTVGRKAETIPLRVHIRDAEKKIDRRFNMRLIKDPMFTPQLMLNLMLESMQTTLGLDSGKTVKIAYNLQLKNAPDIRRENVTYSDDLVLFGAATEVLDALSLTQANPFEKGALEGLDMRVEVVPGRKTATLRRIYPDRNRVKAGETVTVTAELEPTDRPDETIRRQFQVVVPANSPDGQLRVAVSSGNFYWTARRGVGGTPPQVGNLPELVNAYSEIGPNNELVLLASTPDRVLQIDRKRVDNPPTLWNRLLTPSSGARIYNETTEQRRRDDYVVSGLQLVTIPVESVRHSDRERPDGAAPEEGSSSTSVEVLENETTPMEIEEDMGGLEEVAVRNSFDGHAFGFPADDWTRGLDLQIRASRWQRDVLLNESRGANLSTNSQANLQISPLAPVTPTPSATPTPSGTPTPTPTPSPTPEAGAAGIARPAGRWVQRTAQDFRRGEGFGTLVRDDGTVVPGPRQTLVASTNEPVAWSVVSRGNAVYIGTGHAGRLLKIENGQTRVLYDENEVAVSALAFDGKGQLYAGISPGGRVYRVKDDGKRELVAQTGATFVHALAMQGEDLLIATGGQRGALYRVPNVANAGVSSQIPPLVATLEPKHLRSLSVQNGTIYAGTGSEAVLYRIEAGGVVQALYQATTTANTPSSATSSSSSTASAAQNVGSQPLGGLGFGSAGSNTVVVTTTSSAGARIASSGNEIEAVAALSTPAGDAVFFGTLASGSVWRWTQRGGVQEFWKSPGRSIYALKMRENGQLYVACDGGEVWNLNVGADATTIAPASVRATRLLDAPQPQVLALDLDGDAVFAATGNNAAVFRAGGSESERLFVSNVFDASQIVRWGALRFIGEGATIETRSGNTLEPDASWSSYAPLGADNLVVSPPARYLQYRANLSENGRISRIETVFRAPNRAPRVELKNPLGGEAFSGKPTLSWTGSDPDKDALRYSLTLRDASGKETPLDNPKPTQSSFAFDTKKFADGAYTLVVRASDATRNPEDPQSVTTTSLPFVVDNTAPTLAEVSISSENGLAVLRSSASDEGSRLAGAEWRVLAPKTEAKTEAEAETKTEDMADDEATNDETTDEATTEAEETDDEAEDEEETETPKKSNGAWQAIAASDGIFDSTRETLIGRFDPQEFGLKAGEPVQIEVRVRDRAGNSHSRILTITPPVG